MPAFFCVTLELSGLIVWFVVQIAVRMSFRFVDGKAVQKLSSFFYTSTSIENNC